MVTKENGLRYAKLVHVSVENGLTAQSNKVYIMEEQSDGKIKCEYGRVGKNMTTVFKGSHEWGKIYSQKTSSRKGYKDMTEMTFETEEVVDDNAPKKKSTVADIADRTVKSVFDDLMAFANKSIKKNYKVTQSSVTEAQVDAAQEVITKAVKALKKGVDIKVINDLLIELYTIIPRNMSDVRDHLIKAADKTADLDFAKNLLNNEQDTLDTMAGQVKLIKQQREAAKDAKDDGKDAVKTQDITILEQMGLEAEVETDKDALALVNKLMGPNANQVKKILKVINKKTQKAFDANLKKADNKKRRLYWHGSRNENWFNIIQTGLMIRPSGAIHTGSMFGDGIYFADKAQKSIGYSSFNGYWTGGRADKGYLALFDVHLGKEKEILHHNSSCYSLSKKVLAKDGYNSVFAKGGADLRNNEFIVYDGAQCTIAYLVEIG